MSRILAINPGSTSTKLAQFDDERQLASHTLRHSDETLREFAGRPILSQLDMRLAAVTAACGGAGFDAVVGRGGLLAPVPGGTYVVDDDVLADLRAAERGEHASSLGPFLADRMARRAGCPAYIVDPVSVDEWEPVARLSGLAGVERESLSHALNTKAVARRHAREVGRAYEELRLVVVHLGSGITVSAHRDGRMVDACNSMEEGPFAMDRAGGVPAMKLLTLALAIEKGAPVAEKGAPVAEKGAPVAEKGAPVAEKGAPVAEKGAPSAAALRRRLFGEGGVYSYLGTRELPVVLARIDAGDVEAAAVIDALLYQVAKEAGAMAAVLEGRVDAVLVTGGMAHAERISAALTGSLCWIAPVRVHPGEDELRALAEGALRVLRGEAPALRYAESRLRRR
jgi:butyrate kinase